MTKNCENLLLSELLKKSDEKVRKLQLLCLTMLLTKSDEKVRKNLVIQWSFVIQWTFVGDTKTLEMVIRKWHLSV